MSEPRVLTKTCIDKLEIAVEALESIADHDIYKSAFPEYPLTEIAKEALSKIKSLSLRERA